MHHKRVNKDTYAYVVDKTSARLSNWKVKSLSLAGHYTLRGSVINAIINYVMQSSLIPQSTCDIIKRKSIYFLQGSAIANPLVTLVLGI